ncbi:MAG TPA: hypothetical protein PLN33_03820 [Hyphomonadaceae bacterium]|nr:hypothetical protein [Hyphomonadaceae bacterium]HPN04323.1 hypothetical protein [Hyphomonadaceae bacterium]
MIAAPPVPPARLNLAVTGHREGNPAFAANRSRVEVVLTEILGIISDAVKAEAAHEPVAATRLHSMLAEGFDLMAAEQALARGWELVAPLPFGLDLNIAINALPATADDARAMIAGGDPASIDVKRRADAIRSMAKRALLFELAERDKIIGNLFLAGLQYPDDRRKADTFAAESSLRVENAARVMIEHSDILIGVWDGVTRAFIGGTGHTVQLALEIGAPVIWIDANAPDNWRILYNPESLASIHVPTKSGATRTAELHALVRASMSPAPARKAHGQHGGGHGHETGPEAFNRERWREKSNPLFHGYRRVEALFGANNWKGRFRNLRQTYETPEAISKGSAAPGLAHVRSLPGQDSAFVDAVETSTIRRFAWADGVSAYLSDAYRGGMTLNFILAPLSIIGGVAYLPFASSNEKWIFAALELALLGSILAITMIGQRRRWHTRWFETRRVAEYVRHALVMLPLGVVRPPSRWPKGAETSWPEWYARRSLREPGLPRAKLTQPYLRSALQNLLDTHVVQQRDYHRYKAARLAAAHHNLDKLSEALFALAVFSVSTYLVLKFGGVQHWWPKALADKSSYTFTFLGVALPTLGAAIAGLRYFGDFERFSSISEVTAERLSGIHARITQLLEGPEAALDYGQVAELAREVDETVINEIESWQAVFAGKHVAVPV